MNKKIAILRGINVGGKRKILMADLRLLLENIGCSNVQTYIQSGNAIFDISPKCTDLELMDTIEQAIVTQYGFAVPVLIITPQILQKAVTNNPFYQNQEVDITSLHLTFLKEKPTAAHQLKAESYNYEPDQFVIQDQLVFLFCAGKYHQSKLTNRFFEQKLKVTATTRNWKTVLKLLALSKS